MYSYSVGEWQQRIIKKLIHWGTHTTRYEIKSHNEFIKSVGSGWENNAQTAYELLLEKKIIEEYSLDNKIFYALNFVDKLPEIEKILKEEPFDKQSDLLLPSSELENYKEEFRDATSRGWPNRGIYYYCTDTSDINFWITLIKTRPNVKPYKIILGSTKEENSRIMRIWRGVLKVSKTNKGPFIRKWVENIEQEACGNNRLPSRCAFGIFVHLGWLKVVKEKGQSKFYVVIKKD